MLAPEFRRVLFNQRRSLVILWVLFFALLAVFISFRASLLQHLPPARQNYPYAGLIRILIWAVACLTAAFLLWSKQRFYGVEAIFQGSKVPGRPKALLGESPLEKGAARVVAYYRARMMAAYLLADSIGIYGLLLALVRNYFWDQRLLSALSAILLILFYPSRDFFEELIKKCEMREVET